MKTTYLSCAETARLVRQALKKAFPAVKFSVRSSVYAGGASIDVSWIDGPTEKMVEPVAKQFQGGGFDGMIDLKHSHDSWLSPDGSAIVASKEGTEGSGGTVPAERNWMPHPDCKLVSFGADFIFCERRHSERFLRHAAARLARRGFPEFASAEFEQTSWGHVSLKDGHRSVEDGSGVDRYTMLHRECVNLIVA